MRVFSCIIFTILLVVSLSAVALAGEVVVPFVSAQADITDAGDGNVILKITDFSSFTSPGDPALPFTAIRVLLPPNADVRTLHVEIRNPIEEELPGTFNVAPTPPFVTYVGGQMIEDWCGKQIENGKNIAIYGKDEFFPSSYAALDYEGRLDQFLLVPVKLHPYRWNPVTGKMLHLVSGQVAIMFDTVAITQSITPASRVMMDRLANFGVANIEQSAAWYSTQRLAAVTPTPLSIITTSAIVSGSAKLADYVAHKTNMGFSVTVATEADWGGGTGDAAAENIKSWLKANYQTKAAYAVLIGNPHTETGDVPMKMLWPRHNAQDDWDKDGPSDYYYADMTGNWDRDGDGYYGEEPDDFGIGGIDRIPEVIVGRIPYYGVITDLDKILQKIINYESAAEVGSWVQRMLLPMKPLGEGDSPEGGMWELGEIIRNTVAKPAGLGYFRIYDKDYDIMPPPEKTPCNENNVINEWKKGYGFAFWMTHGWPQGASDIISSPNCYQLDDTKPSFVFSASCSTGAPELSDNLGYMLLRNGAIATASSARLSWNPGAEHYAKYLARYRQKCGNALFSWKTNLSIDPTWSDRVCFNLYGDPTVSPRWPTTPVTVETTSVPVGKAGKSYSVDLIASGGTFPYTWTLHSGQLPTGLTLNPSGVITGTTQSSGYYVFTVNAMDDDGVSSTKELSMEVDIRVANFELSTDPGWTREGDWAYGTPTGEGSFNHDPTSGHTGNNVFGYNLNGDYPNNLSVKYLTTTVIDCSNLSHTKLSFWRWLGVDAPYNGGFSADRARVQISDNGSIWSTAWSNSSSISDSEWTKQTIDISSLADGKSTIYIRWSMGPTNSSVTYPGWNIDDVEVWGCPWTSLAGVTPIKSMADITSVTVQDQVISAAYPEYFYIQDPDSSQGIRVAWPAAVTEGKRVMVRGMLRTVNREREIAAETVTQGGVVGQVQPLAMNIPALGGGAFSLQEGILGSFGLNNIGMLVKIAGNVTQVGTDYFYIDDGSGIQDGTLTGTTPNIGVRVAWPGMGLSSDQFLAVVGISSGFINDGNFLRCILPRRTSDIQPQ